MKKLFAALLAVMIVVSMATVASAETTTLTTTVPNAEYILNVPKEVPIAFGATASNIGSISVSNATGFALGKNLEVEITYDDFKADGVKTTIPFSLLFKEETQSGKLSISSGDRITFWGRADGTVDEYARPKKDAFIVPVTQVIISSDDWGKALAGDYTATITYVCEVVAEE